MEDQIIALFEQHMDVSDVQILPEGMWMFEGVLHEPADHHAEQLLDAASHMGFYLHTTDISDGMVRVVLIPRPKTKKSNPWVNIVLFVLTLFSTLAVGAVQEGVNIFVQPWMIYKGLPFSLSIMFILLVHEMGHYFASKLHNVEATLPYFIPFPSLIGTMGAVIRIKSPIPTRKALMDIGAAGPIAGMLVALPLTFIGLKLSSVVPTQGLPGSFQLGNSLLFQFLSWLALGNLPPGHDVVLHPIAFAGWIGFFITALNLLPIGQLDGGHVAYAMLGKNHKYLAWGMWGALIAGGIFWAGWWLWAVLVLVFGIKHPPPLAATVRLDPKRKAIGWICLALFVLTLVPVPFSVMPG